MGRILILALGLSSCATNTTGFLRSECAPYFAALEAAGFNPDSAAVAARHTVGAPIAALEGVTDVKAGDVLLADSTYHRLGQTSAGREPLPQCLSEAGYTLVDDPELMQRFSPTGPRWEWPGIRGLALISEPIYSADGEELVIFVGSARGPLSGIGRIFRFQQRDGRWVKMSEVTVWES